MTHSQINRHLKSKIKLFKKERKFMLGLPGNLDFSYKKLYPFFEFLLNNVGDPYVDSNYKIHTKDLERKLLSFFGTVYNMGHNYWGYITNGGTESNMYGIMIGRNISKNPKLFFSEDTHYSIKKIANILNLKYEIVKSDQNGEINYDNLKRILLKNKAYSPILNLNIGTTFKGAIDNVGQVVKIIDEINIKNYYIHCDAALFGGFLPFINKKAIDFSLPIQSLTISGHKFFGCPMPCGVLLIKNKMNKLGINQRIEYISSVDTTISGSRNGHTVLMLWYKIMNDGIKALERDAHQCIGNAKYLFDQLKKKGVEAYLNPDSIIVYFKKPSKQICEKWQLSTMNEFAHIVVMPHVNKKMINNFLKNI